MHLKPRQTHFIVCFFSKKTPNKTVDRNQLSQEELSTHLTSLGHPFEITSDLANLERIVLANSQHPLILIIDSTMEETTHILEKNQNTRTHIILLTKEKILNCTAALLHHVHFTIDLTKHHIARILLRSTLQKIISKNIFGLECYFREKPNVWQHKLHADDNRSEIIKTFQNYAMDLKSQIPIGISEFVRKSCEVLDEFLMNAIWDANPSQLALPGPVVVSWASEDSLLMISVKDAFGTFNNDTVLKYQDEVLGIHSQKAYTVNKIGRGAGIGLHMVLRRVSCLVINKQSHKFTEFIALIDLSRSPKHLDVGSTPIHFFEV